VARAPTGQPVNHVHRVQHVQHVQHADHVEHVNHAEPMSSPGFVANLGRMTDYTVTVTGATGKTGGHVAALASARGWRVRAAGRRPAAHGEFTRLDWDDETTWGAAFAGSDAAYIVIPFNHPGAPRRAPRLIEAAAGAGVRRVVLLSSADVEHAPADDPTRVAEETCARLPVASAAVRPTWFLDNFTVGSLAGMTAAGDLRLPAGDGRIPFVDVRDVAAVAVAALAEDGPTGALPVTGPAAVDHGAVAAALGAALGRPVRYTSVSVDEFVALMAERGFSTEYGRFLGDALADVAHGRLRVPVADTVERLVGRRPYTAAEFADHAARHGVMAAR